MPKGTNVLDIVSIWALPWFVMVLKKRVLAFLGCSFLLGFLSFAAPPMAWDAFFTTIRDTPVKVVLVATDQGIDPNRPEVHPLVFTILTPPYHGALSGDIHAVSYEEPYKAVVELTYEPVAGFVGSDHFVYTVADPAGFFATGIVRVDVVRPPAPPPTLSGSMDTYVTLDPTGVKEWGGNLRPLLTIDIFNRGFHFVDIKRMEQLLFEG